VKTRHIFEIGDFDNGGKMIVRNSSPSGSSDVGFMASVSYKIGYILSPEGSVARIALTDGQVIPFIDEKELVDALNSDSWGYRPMTDEECEDVAAEVTCGWDW